MQRIFTMYKLKAGVSIDEYRKFSVEIDQKITPNQPGVKNFEVFEIKGSESGNIPCQIVDIIDVDSWETWQKITGSDAMKQVGAEWVKYADESTVVTIFGEKI